MLQACSIAGDNQIVLPARPRTRAAQTRRFKGVPDERRTERSFFFAVFARSRLDDSSIDAVPRSAKEREVVFGLSPCSSTNPSPATHAGQAGKQAGLLFSQQTNAGNNSVPPVCLSVRACCAFADTCISRCIYCRCLQPGSVCEPSPSVTMPEWRCSRTKGCYLRRACVGRQTCADQP